MLYNVCAIPENALSILPTQNGGVLRKYPFIGRGIDMFWNYTISGSIQRKAFLAYHPPL